MKEKWRVKKNHRVLWDVVWKYKDHGSFLNSSHNPNHRFHRAQNDHNPLRPLFGKADFQVIFHCSVTMGTETHLLASPLASPVFLLLFFFFSQRYYCGEKKNPLNYSAHSLNSIRLIRLTQRGSGMIATSPSCHVIETGTQHTNW